MATANKATVKPSGPVPAITVVCATPGFRRGGRAWGPEAQTVALSELKKEQLEQIRGEPRLVVVDTEINLDAEASEADTGSKPS